MSNPATAATDNSGQQNDSGEKSFQQQVNEATSQLVQSDDGNWSFPEGIELSEAVQFAAMGEKRRRDTQSALAKANNKVAVLSKENTSLKDLVTEQMQVNISPQQQDELDELKFSDPDAWRAKMNEHEQTALTQVQSKLSDISENATSAGIEGERQVILQAFIDDNPGFEINDDILANDVPPRISKELEDGKVTFYEFLGNVKDYLDKGTKVADNAADTTTNLSEVGGSDNPDQNAEQNAEIADYENSIF